MKKLLLLLLFLIIASCVSPNKYNITQYNTLIFNDKLTFDEFNILLDEYVKTSPYPKIDN